MTEVEDIEQIRPYNDNEINQALKRIISEPVFDKILDFLLPGTDKEQIKSSLANTFSAHDFQLQFMHPLVTSIVNKTTRGLTFDGFEKLTKGTPYLFVANHRDIVLDSAILQVLLFDNGLETSEITFGSNLMINQFVIDMGKVNRMFKVERGGNKIELLRNSKILSDYLRHTITTKRNSVWIAQRPGRTKDGNDKTEAGLLKMFHMSCRTNFGDSFRELNIVPLSISYELEPCCALKVKEVFETSIYGSYQKRPDEDLKSIITGLTQQKGRIHLSVGTPVNEYLDRLEEEDILNNKLNKLAKMIDDDVYRHYRLWPNNYIASDLLNRRADYSEYYTSAQKEDFLGYMHDEIRELPGDAGTLEKLFLNIYSNPLLNAARVI